MGTQYNDPRLKFFLKRELNDILYKPYHARREKVLDLLVRQNAVLQQTQVDAFSFKGANYYASQPMYLQQKVVIPRLHRELQPQMEEWLREQDQVMCHELPYIDNYLALVMNASPAMQDWLGLLPDVLHEPVKRAMQGEKPIASMMPPREIKRITTTHQHAIDLIRQRMAINLIFI